MKKVGILGGGQLGRMLLQAAINYPVDTWVMESDPSCPAAHLCHHFVQGDIRNFDDVYAFGKKLDSITIEIESVNVDALEKLDYPVVMGSVLLSACIFIIINLFADILYRIVDPRIKAI